MNNDLRRESMKEKKLLLHGLKEVFLNLKSLKKENEKRKFCKNNKNKKSQSLKHEIKQFLKKSLNNGKFEKIKRKRFEESNKKRNQNRKSNEKDQNPQFLKNRLLSKIRLYINDQATQLKGSKM